MRKLNPIGKIFALEIADELPCLWKANPDGLTIKGLCAALDMPYNDAYSACGWLVQLGRAQWVQRPDRNVTLLVPVEWQQPAAWGLTEKQRAVLEWLSAQADEDGVVSASMGDIAKGALNSAGGIVAHLETIQKKNYLRFLDRGGHHKKSVFRVFPKGDATGPVLWPGNRPAFTFDEWAAQIRAENVPPRDSGRHAQRGDPSGAPSEGCQSGDANAAHRPPLSTERTPHAL